MSRIPFIPILAALLLSILFRSGEFPAVRTSPLSVLRPSGAEELSVGFRKGAGFEVPDPAGAERMLRIILEPAPPEFDLSGGASIPSGFGRICFPSGAFRRLAGPERRTMPGRGPPVHCGLRCPVEFAVYPKEIQS